MANMTGSANGTIITDNKNDNKSEGLSDGEIAAIALGVFFIIVAIAVPCFKLRKSNLKLSRKGSTKNPKTVVNTSHNGGFEHEDVEIIVENKTGVKFAADDRALSKRYSISAFQKQYSYILENHHALVKEYKSLTNRCSKRSKGETSIGKSPVNIGKNRDISVIPNNRYLVPLIHGNDMHATGEYINASYVDGHYRAKEYISSQVPLETTQGDFWTMVYNEQVQLIIVLCHFEGENSNIVPFWAKQGLSANFAKLRVRLFEETIDSIITRRKFKVQEKEGQGTVLDCTLLQFHSWTNDIPDDSDSLLVLLQEFRKRRMEMKRLSCPTVVICRNGVESSGVFLALSIAIDILEEDHMVDLVQTVTRIRKFRNKFVNNLEQYQLCYDCLYKYVKSVLKLEKPT